VRRLFAHDKYPLEEERAMVETGKVECQRGCEWPC
jgi:hypothetical protein